MPRKEIKHPDKQADTGAYSAGLEADGWVYVSGQASLDLKTGRVVGDTIEEQTKLTLANVEKILQAAGCTLSDVVKSTVHLADIGEFDRFNAAYLDCFKNAGPLPARTTVGSALIPGFKVEIDVVARKSS